MGEDEYLNYLSEYIEKYVFKSESLLVGEDLPHKMLWAWFKISGSDDLCWSMLSSLEALDYNGDDKDMYISYEGPYYEKGII